MANLEKRGIRVIANPELPPGNPANYHPIDKVLEYNPSTFRYIDLLHESRHIAQFKRAAAKGLDLQEPFCNRKLYAWLEKGALDYEIRLADRFKFSWEYQLALQDALKMYWKRKYQQKYYRSPSFRTLLEPWWN